MSVVAETEAAIAAAKHLTGMDAGAVATLRVLARKIDNEDAAREAAIVYAIESGGRPPALDNVSIPTYLKYCDSLGLTPAGRARLDQKPEEPSGKLAQLRAINGGQAAQPSQAKPRPKRTPKK